MHMTVNVWSCKTEYLYPLIVTGQVVMWTGIPAHCVLVPTIWSEREQMIWMRASLVLFHVFRYLSNLSQWTLLDVWPKLFFSWCLCLFVSHFCLSSSSSLHLPSFWTVTCTFISLKKKPKHWLSLWYALVVICYYNNIFCAGALQRFHLKVTSET